MISPVYWEIECTSLASGLRASIDDQLVGGGPDPLLHKLGGLTRLCQTLKRRMLPIAWYPVEKYGVAPIFLLGEMPTAARSCGRSNFCADQHQHMTQCSGQNKQEKKGTTPPSFVALWRSISWLDPVFRLWSKICPMHSSSCHVFDIFGPSGVPLPPLPQAEMAATNLLAG